MRSPIDEYMDELKHRLGWRARFERRTLQEIGDHLHDAVADLQTSDLDTVSAERTAVSRLGDIQSVKDAVIESNRGLTMLSFLRKNSLWTTAALLLPAAALLMLSFLTFNFPCRPSPQSGFETCGLSFLQGLRPLLTGPESNVALIGLKFALTVLAPLVAAVVLLGRRSTLDVERAPDGPVVRVAFELSRVRVAGAFVSVALFVTVVAYQLAG